MSYAFTAAEISFLNVSIVTREKLTEAAAQLK